MSRQYCRVCKREGEVVVVDGIEVCRDCSEILHQYEDAAPDSYALTECWDRLMGSSTYAVREPGMSAWAGPGLTGLEAERAALEANRAGILRVEIIED